MTVGFFTNSKFRSELALKSETCYFLVKTLFEQFSQSDRGSKSGSNQISCIYYSICHCDEISVILIQFYGFYLVNNRLLCPDLFGFGGHILATSLKNIFGSW